MGARLDSLGLARSVGFAGAEAAAAAVWEMAGKEGTLRAPKRGRIGDLGSLVSALRTLGEGGVS